MRGSGGNTDELYLIEDGRLKMAEALAELHPDVATVTWKFGRWQHHVNYKPFKRNKLIKVEDSIQYYQGINNYGMVVKEYDEKMHITKLVKKLNGIVK